MSKTEAYVDPDAKFIISATQDTAILVAQVGIGDEGERVLLYVPRQVFHAAMSHWLDGKAEYHRHGEFAGSGIICFTAEQELPGRYWLADTDGEPSPIKAYTAETFGVDMEHG